MREFLHLDVLANWVSMLRAEVSGALLLSDDDEESRFYERCVHEEGRVIPASNVAVSLLDAVEGRGVQGLVATVTRRRAPSPARMNVFVPQDGDVACLLLSSRAAQRVLLDLCGLPWLTTCAKTLGVSLPERAFRIAGVLYRMWTAYGRQENAQADMARRLVDYGDLSINWTQLESASADAGLGVDAVTNERDAFERGAAATNECEGMEALRVLAEATRSFAPRGIRSRSQVSANELFSMLRVAYELEDLEKDSMFWSMRSWERANLSYPLLKGWRIRDPFGILLDQRYWELDLSVLLGGMTESQQLVAAKMDLDGFKQVNDLLGHSKGDDALRLYSRIIEQIFGRVGEVYRRGGDEVVALAIGLDQAAGKVLAEEARLGVEAAMAAWGEPLGLPACPTLSVGVVWIQGKRTLEEVSRLLDEAQMEAKGKGKNCVVCRY